MFSKSFNFAVIPIKQECCQMGMLRGLHTISRLNSEEDHIKTESLKVKVTDCKFDSKVHSYDWILLIFIAFHWPTGHIIHWPVFGQLSSHTWVRSAEKQTATMMLRFEITWNRA